MVPKGWTLLQVSDICKLQNGNSFKPHEWDTQGLPIIRIQNLNGSDNYNYFSGVPQDKWLVEPGQLLFSWAGTKGVSFGPFIWNGPKGVLNQHIYKVFANENVHGHWLYLALLHITQKIEAQAHGFKSTLLHVQKKDIDNQFVLTPPVAEQKKMAQILSTWDKAISVTEKLLTNSQQQKKALMQQLLTGKKRLLDERGVRFSGEWEYTIFGNLGDTYTGLTGKTKEDFGAGKPYIPYINIFKNSRIDIQNLEYVQVNDDERQSVVKYGDIFFTTSSETPEEVGMSSVLLEEVSEVFLNSFCFGFRLNNFETLIPKYARYLFRSEHVRRQISTLGQGATRYNLSKRQLIKLELKLPCVEEQQKIAAVLSAADAEISTLEKKLACLRDEKKALMQQLLTGKRRVKVDEAVAE